MSCATVNGKWQHMALAEKIRHYSYNVGRANTTFSMRTRTQQ